MLAGRSRPQSLRPLLRDFGCGASWLCLTEYSHTTSRPGQRHVHRQGVRAKPPFCSFPFLSQGGLQAHGPQLFQKGEPWFRPSEELCAFWVEAGRRFGRAPKPSAPRGFTMPSSRLPSGPGGLADSVAEQTDFCVLLLS